MENPLRTSDVFGGGSDRTRHDVAMSLAPIDLNIHHIFARRTHTRHIHAHTPKKRALRVQRPYIVAIGLSYLGQK